ncbi:MAG: hypothetical protein GY810_26350 [Aureispira sp.]|nr:hypothetical protein [Aureispira sp.]
MKKITYQTLFLALLGLLVLPNSMQAQRKKNVELETKIVRGCEYEVLKGLAEVTEVKKILAADESALKYDEYQILFRFIPMEGGELLSGLKDGDIEFYLKSGIDKLNVGPDYLKHYHIRKGTKYAMKLLQNKMGACLENYTYESGGLPNDLFEARENLMDYRKETSRKRLTEKEEEYETRKVEEEVEEMNNNTNPNELPETDPVEEPEPVVEPEPEPVVDPIEIDPDAEPIDPNITEAELRKQIEEEMLANGEVEETTPTNAEGDVDKDALREQIEAKMRAELEAKIRAEEKAKTEEAARKKEAARKNAVKNAKKNKKEEDKRKKAEAERKAQEKAKAEAERKAQEDRIRKEIEAEVKAKLEEEAAAQRAAEDAEAAAEEESKRRQAELLKKKEELKKEVAQRLADEAKRKNCSYAERQAGTIEVLKVLKVAEAKDSYFGYVEYEVKVLFRPNNYADLSKKDKKIWDEEHVFTIDPQGKNANPSAAYIRKHKVFKGAKYTGFAQNLESGICNQVMLYSPNLPIDKGSIK